MPRKRLRLLLARLAFLLIVGLIIVFLTPINLINFEPKKVPLSIFLPAIQAPYWKELIKDFENKNPNITIKVYEVTDQSNLAEDIYTKKSGNKLLKKYDLVFMDIIWVSELAKQGLLVNLKQYMSSEEEFKELEADFLPNDWKGGLYKNELYRIPFYSDVGVLFYRKDLLAKVKGRPPKTFDDLIEISQELQKKYPNLNLSSYLWPGQQHEGLVAMFVEVLAGYGGNWIDDKDQVGLDKDQAFRAVKFLHDTIKNGISPREVTTFTGTDTISSHLAPG